MKNIITILLLFVSVIVNAQLVVNTGGQTPTQYVQNVLVGGGVTVNNVVFSGNTNQIGTFNAANTNPFLGITDGLILATGDVNVAIGPNNVGNADLGGGNLGSGDPDLDVLVGPGVGTNDAAILEFDFIPTGDTVRFNFVFGSEEYPEFVNSINDAFGFFLSGPGIMGPFTNNATNIALVPGTTTPITINNVNSASNAAYYVDNVPNTGAQSIQFDGYTTVMTAISAVQCGQTHHIKIAIADASDAIYDSGVFLEAGSFSSNTVTLSSNIDLGGNDSILYEGCGTALLDFVRSDTTDTSVVHFNISGTAGNGIDYPFLPDSIIFYPGQDTNTIALTANQDGITEPLETVTIQLIQTICGVQDTQTVSFYIADYPALTVVPHDTLISCPGDSVPIWFDVLGPDNTIIWAGGQSTDTIWVMPSNDTYYAAIIQDTCGVNIITDSVFVSVPIIQPFVITTSNDTSKYCPQDSIVLNVIPAGGSTPYQYLWSNGNTTNSIKVSPATTTMYYIRVTDVCGNTLDDSVQVVVPNYVPLTNNIFNNDTSICPGDLVILDANINGGVGTYFSWNFGLGNTLPLMVNPFVPTTYILTANDSCGSQAVDSVVISMLGSNFSISTVSDSMECLNEQLTLTVNILNGTGNENILWSNGATTQSINVMPNSTTVYTVTVSDVCNSYTDSAVAYVPVFAPVNLNINNDTLIECPGEDVLLHGYNTGGTQNNLLITWSDGLTSFGGNNITVNPIQTTTYTAYVYDTCAFDGDTVSFTITVPVYPPLQLVSSKDTLICYGDEITIGALATGGAGGYVYNWPGYSGSDSITVAPKETTNYKVVVTDKCGNQLQQWVTVRVSKPIANFTYEYISDYTVEFTDSSYSNIVSHYWIFELDYTSTDINPIHTFNNSGEHDVTLIVTNQIGCMDTIVKTIYPPIHVYAPNAFTPNGDGTNEKFYFNGMGIEQFEVYIFDRWGELLYSSNDITQGWNGVYKGNPLPTGVYVYRLKAIGYNDKKFTKMGTINLLR